MLYKDQWVSSWRNLGHLDASGAWIPPISFYEAQFLPSRMLNIFFELDHLVAKMMKPGKNKP